MAKLRGGGHNIDSEGLDIRVAVTVGITTEYPLDPQAIQSRLGEAFSREHIVKDDPNRLVGRCYVISFDVGISTSAHNIEEEARRIEGVITEMEEAIEGAQKAQEPLTWLREA